MRPTVGGQQSCAPRRAGDGNRCFSGASAQPPWLRHERRHHESTHRRTLLHGHRVRWRLPSQVSPSHGYAPDIGLGHDARLRCHHPHPGVRRHRRLPRRRRQVARHQARHRSASQHTGLLGRSRPGDAQVGGRARRRRLLELVQCRADSLEPGSCGGRRGQDRSKPVRREDGGIHPYLRR